LIAISLSFLTLLLGPVAHAAGEDGRASARPGSLALRLVDPHELLPAGSREVASEITRVFADLGVSVRFDWDEAVRPPGYPLRVVLLPSEPGGPGWRVPPNALGVTIGDGVRSAPAVYVFYPRLLRALGIPEREDRLPSSLELRHMTRALGRVVAHEIFHALAPGQPHAESGLMSASLSETLLLGEEIDVDERWAGLLRWRLSQLSARSVLK